MFYYSAEKNIQMLVYLLKAHGIKRIIVSPGTTNVTFAVSIQHDPYFITYSVADERSAAYMACGLAAESGEPVAISCTGATASRNYLPGLTEAYYRKLPVLAITSTQHTGRIGQLCPQVIDRSVLPKDAAVMSVNIPTIQSTEDEWDCNVKLNSAILALKHRGGGPVHINLCTTYNRNFDIRKLPEFRMICRVGFGEQFPNLKGKRTAVFVGAHGSWTGKLTKLVERFCEQNNGCVICDHTSNYQGKYKVQYNLINAQSAMRDKLNEMDLLIDMGEMSGAYMTLRPKEVWRVSPDGVIRDTFRKLTYMFDMSEEEFFERLITKNNANKTEYYDSLKRKYDEIYREIPELPFSNIWIAKQTASRLPENSVLHLAILNTLRSWNFFNLPTNVDCFTNTGGFGIDGFLSTLVGSSLATPEKLHYGIVGDLAFFYDMNVVANNNVGVNIRILLVNNGCGVEFKNYNHFAAQFGEEADRLIAASGHYGRQSRELVKNYAQNLGFRYLSAENKKQFLDNLPVFLNPEIGRQPILFEVFTNPEKESEALRIINTVIMDEPDVKTKAKTKLKSVLGEKRVNSVKRIIKR